MNQEWADVWRIIENMPCSNQFGKKAFTQYHKNLTVKSYSMPLYSKDQHSAMCANTHTHTHPNTHANEGYTHTYAYTKCFVTVYQSLLVPWYCNWSCFASSLLFFFFCLNQNTLQGAINQLYILVKSKQPCVQTVANHRLEETMKALIKEHSPSKPRLLWMFYYLCKCACVRVFSFMINKSGTKEEFVTIIDSDVTVAFADKRGINYWKLVPFWKESLVCVSYQTFVLWSFSSFMLSLHIFS